MTPFLFIYLLSCTLDGITTPYGLTHGAREQWLPTQNPYVADSIIAGQAAGGFVIQHNLPKRASKWTLIGLTAIRLGAVTYSFKKGIR